MAKLPVKRTVSAGGVVYRLNDSHVEVLLVGKSRLSTWGLPKGTPQGEESLDMTAVREVGEETGLQVEIIAPLTTVRYWFARVAEGFRYDKTVHFYLMRAVGGDIARHDWEHDEVRWFPLTEALRSLTYRNEAAVLRRAAETVNRLEEQSAQASAAGEEHDAA